VKVTKFVWTAFK